MAVFSSDILVGTGAQPTNNVTNLNSYVQLGCPMLIYGHSTLLKNIYYHNDKILKLLSTVVAIQMNKQNYNFL